MAKYSDKQALDELKQAIDEIDNVRKKPRLSPKFKAWQIETSELLDSLFGRSSKQVKEFDRIPYSLAAFSNQTPDSKFDEAFQQGLKAAAISLSSAVKEIQTNGVGGKNKNTKATTSKAKVSAPANAEKKNIKPEPARKILAPPVKEEAQETAAPIEGGKVLVVGVSDNGVDSDLNEFLTKIGLQPVSVINKTSQHDMLLEVLEENQDAQYAIVLLGFDDDNDSKDDAFGLGVLVGRLGRDRVCAVVNDKMTSIDTYSSISYVPVDAAGAWKFMMIKNLKTAGFEVDANLAL